MKKLFLNDRFILWMILLNAITIFIQGFEMDSRYLNLARVADNFFTMIFLAEMVFKIREYGFSGYWAKNWNKFDSRSNQCCDRFFLQTLFYIDTVDRRYFRPFPGKFHLCGCHGQRQQRRFGKKSR